MTTTLETYDALRMKRDHLWKMMEELDEMWEGAKQEHMLAYEAAYPFEKMEKDDPRRWTMEACSAQAKVIALKKLVNARYAAIRIQNRQLTANDKEINQVQKTLWAESQAARAVKPTYRDTYRLHTNTATYRETFPGDDLAAGGCPPCAPEQYSGLACDGDDDDCDGLPDNGCPACDPERYSGLNCDDGELPLRASDAWDYDDMPDLYLDWSTPLFAWPSNVWANEDLPAVQLSWPDKTAWHERFWPEHGETVCLVVLVLAFFGLLAGAHS